MPSTRRLIGSLVLFLVGAGSAAAQAPRAFPFRATNYDVQVQLQPESQTLTALVKVDFAAKEVGRTLLVELHPDLHITSVKSANGQQLSFQRDNNDPLYLSVGLPETATPGKQVSVTFEYNGPISNEEDSPTKGVRFGSIDKTSAYLLLPARWFPLTDFPSNRYTGTFKIIVPESFVVVGTGTAQAPKTTPGIGKGLPEPIRIRVQVRQARARGNIRCRRVATFSGADRGLSVFGLHTAGSSFYGNSLCGFCRSYPELLH